MQVLEEQWIGKVCLKYIGADKKESPVYSDGRIEDELCRRFETDPNYDQLSEDAGFKSWAEEYHLSAIRHNLLKWLPFNAGGSVLEVGAGCGALTGLLCDKLKRVTALEYSHKRALITARRHSKRSNLEVIVGGLRNFESKKRFDYIIVVGVLEYASVFYGGEDPYASFLTKLRQMLNPDGTLVLAIENKIGLKYITGAPEDHTGRVFESIYGYPSAENVRTFCKRELTGLLHSSGFCYLDWYYPLPDYKLPQVIISDDAIPNDWDPLWSLCPSITGGFPRKEVILEEKLGKALAKAGLFGEFSNSFLVIAKTRASREKRRCLRFEAFNVGRKPQFITETIIFEDNLDRCVLKKAATETVKPFLKLIAKREKDSEAYLKGTFEVLCGKLEGDHIKYDYLPYPLLRDTIASHLQKGDVDKANGLFKVYVDKIQSLKTITTVPEQFLTMVDCGRSRVKGELTCLHRGLVDLTPKNIFVDGQRLIVFDNEWSFDFPIPVVFVIFRAIREMMVVLQLEIRRTTSSSNPALALFARGLGTYYVPVAWANHLTSSEISLGKMLGWEMGFQQYVTGYGHVGRLRKRHKIRKIFSHRELANHAGALGNIAPLFKATATVRKIAHYLDQKMSCGRTTN